MDDVRELSREVCLCGDPMVKHLRVNLGGDTQEYGACTLCPCRTYRCDATASAAS